MAKILNILAVTDNPNSSYALSQAHKQYHDLGLFVCQSAGDFAEHTQAMADAVIIEAFYRPAADDPMAVGELLRKRMQGVKIPWLITTATDFVQLSVLHQMKESLGYDNFGNKRMTSYVTIPWGALLDYSILLAKAPEIPNEVQQKVSRLLCTRHGESLHERISAMMQPQYHDFLHGSNLPLWEQDAVQEMIAAGEHEYIWSGNANPGEILAMCKLPESQSYTHRKEVNKLSYDAAARFIQETLKEYRR